MGLIGTEIAKMHMADIIHGDLTTSNMMLRHTSSPYISPSGQISPATELVLIDFGLAYNSNIIEDKAVDLYVLERAFSSTHPDSEPLFTSVLNAYQHKVGKEWSAVGKRLDDVRLRGRKRSMVG
jgi:TP53 regulating kinase-like protein